jgi:hypothetical protein
MGNGEDESVFVYAWFGGGHNDPSNDSSRHPNPSYSAMPRSSSAHPLKTHRSFIGDLSPALTTNDHNRSISLTLCSTVVHSVSSLWHMAPWFDGTGWSRWYLYLGKGGPGPGIYSRLVTITRANLSLGLL